MDELTLPKRPRYAPYTADEIRTASAAAPGPDLDALNKITTAWIGRLDHACQIVLASGYQPEECLIEHRHESDRVTRHVLKVREVPCFEVAVEIERPEFRTRLDRATREQLEIAVPVTPRVIAWPETVWP